MGPRVLLTTTMPWPVTARLAAALAAVGAHVEALLPAIHPARASRFVARVHAYNPLRAASSLSRAVAAATPDIVLPGDDRALVQLLSLDDKALLARSLGRPEAYATLLTRRDFIDAVRALGLAAPKMVRIEDETGLAAALDAVGMPAAMKLDGSWGGEGTGIVRDLGSARAAMRRFESETSRLRFLLRAARRRDLHFLVEAFSPAPHGVNLQAFVAGRPATSAFACWKGRVLAAIHMNVLETARDRGPATVMRRVECGQMDRAVIRVAEHFGLSGLHGLDFIRDEAGAVHVLEINARVTQAATFAFGPGHDLAAALMGAMSRTECRPRPALTDNPVIALFPQEWRRDPRSGWLASGYHDIPWDDPGLLNACLAPGERIPPPRRTADKQAEPALTLRSAVGR